MGEHATTYGEQIRQLVEPVVEYENMELIDIECLKMKSRWLVRIYIDKEGGVTVEDCSEVSKQVGDVLDVHDIPPGPYTLEVSSPGLDRPLVRDKDFLKYRGSQVHIRLTEKLEGAKNLRGKLIEYLEEGNEKIVVVDVSGRIFRIPKTSIVKARLEYEFEK